MSYEIYLTRTAADELARLSQPQLQPYVEWIRHELSDPATAGIALQGRILQGLRVLNRPGLMQVVFVPNPTKSVH